MANEFVELKSTENQTVFVRPEAVSAFEVVPASNRVEGHIKVFIAGFKFLVQGDQDELLKQLNSQGK
ncbi:MAG: hypothetical protein KF799_04960 [Bdellovibrionales bacterium]|nr:hypothetical protein [Bdellovibrionales bacterium]